MMTANEFDGHRSISINELSSYCVNNQKNGIELVPRECEIGFSKAVMNPIFSISEGRDHRHNFRKLLKNRYPSLVLYLLGNNCAVCWIYHGGDYHSLSSEHWAFPSTAFTDIYISWSIVYCKATLYYHFHYKSANHLTYNSGISNPSQTLLILCFLEGFHLKNNTFQEHPKSKCFATFLKYESGCKEKRGLNLYRQYLEQEKNGIKIKGEENKKIEVLEMNVALFAVWMPLSRLVIKTELPQLCRI
jgi:hypothetical protein